MCSRVYRSRIFRDEALNSGATEYMPLPMNLDEFVSRVTEIIDNHKGPEGGELTLDVA